MYEGKIIKYYRDKYNLTQKQLGKGICSITHISKIELGQRKYSNETITLLCDRLKINMNLEIEKLINIKQRLFDLNNALIMQFLEDIEQIYNELKQEELIQISEYIHMYQLLHAKYLLLKNNPGDAFIIIKKIQSLEEELTPFESNLLSHVLGIYYLETQDYTKAIQHLKAIQNEIYNNPEYYYHIAIAYHKIQSSVLAYYFAEKSIHYFKQINNYLRMIDAEMLLLIQFFDEMVYDDVIYNDVLNRMKNLITNCDLCNDTVRKAKVVHNLAFVYYQRKKYDLASMYYRESMSLKEKESPSYMLSLEGYIRSSFEGGLISTDELIQQTEAGLMNAIKNNQLINIHLFKLLLYLLKSKEKAYHQYLFNKALPVYKKFGFKHLLKRSKRELFNYYSKKNLDHKALEMAQLFING